MFRRFQANLLAMADNLRLAMGTFMGNPLRTLLTLLGIVIGVTTVIVMMALIEGLRLKVNNDLSQLGANTFEVSKWPSGFGRVNWRMYAKRKDLTLEDMRAIQEFCPSVGVVSASDTSGGQKISSVNVVTRPSVLVTSRVPPCAVVMALVIDRPSPTPFTALRFAVDARKNRVNSWSSSAAGMP